MKEHQKITTGFVIQNYITLPNGTMVCQSQSFVAGDPVNYEADGHPIEIDTDKEVYCPLEMQAPKQVSTDGVKFICPDCKGTRLECCEDGAYNSEVLNIDSEGDFDFGEISASGTPNRFQCLGCGYVLENDEGFGIYSVTEHEEVVEWCQAHCKQE